MDALRNVFPNTPLEVLQTVMRVCGNDVEAASHWMLENDWHDIEHQMNARPSLPPTPTTTATEREERNRPSNENDRQVDDDDLQSEEYHNEDDEDDDEDDDDDDDDDDTVDEDTGDEETILPTLLPPAKRRRIEETPKEKIDPKESRFWVRFDENIVQKSLIELLNTGPSKLAHSNVTLLNSEMNTLTNDTIKKKLTSVITDIDSQQTNTTIVDASEEKKTDAQDLDQSQLTEGIHTEEKGDCNLVERGFWAYFFSVSDVDIVWRSVLHAHLLGKRFGEMIEFHAVMNGSLGVRGFDQLMVLHNRANERHATTIVQRRSESFKCCLILPCSALEKEILNVGQHIHTILNMKSPLYFRILPKDYYADSDILDDGKMTEEYHKHSSTYKIVRSERGSEHTNEGASKSLTYQPPKKMAYLLQHKEQDIWKTCQIE